MQNTVITHKPKITAKDRLVLTVIVAILIHAVLVSGIVFESLIKKDTRKPLPTLDITLVLPNDSELPSKADFLAQANQDSDQDKPEEHFSPEDSASQSNAAEDSASSEALSNLESSPDPMQGQEIDAVVSDEETAFVQKSSVLQEKDDLITDSIEFIKKQKQTDDNNKNITHKYINVRSKRNVEAAYLAKAQKRIEQIGNTNISDEIFFKNISGDVKVDIALNPDGSIYEVKILRSDNPILEAEVKKIIRLSAPFDIISKDVMSGADILHFERIWRFGE